MSGCSGMSNISASQKPKEDEVEEERPKPKKKKAKKPKKVADENEEEQEVEEENEGEEDKKKPKKKKKLKKKPAQEEEESDAPPKKGSVMKKKKAKEEGSMSAMEPSGGQRKTSSISKPVRKNSSRSAPTLPPVMQKSSASSGAGTMKSGTNRIILKASAMLKSNAEGKTEKKTSRIGRSGSKPPSDIVLVQRPSKVSMRGHEGHGKEVDTTAYKDMDVDILQVKKLKTTPPPVVKKPSSGLLAKEPDMNMDQMFTKMEKLTTSNLRRNIDALDPKDDAYRTRHFPKGGKLDYCAFFAAHFNKAGSGPKKIKYSLDQYYRVLADAAEVLRGEPVMVDVMPPVTIIGDIHGQYNDLIAMFSIMGAPPERNYVFLGDYVDRGRMSTEVAMLLLAYKAYYPNSVTLLRGNHECARINSRYGFMKELEEKLGVENHSHIWALFQKVFDLLPVCALVGLRILCMHGGISPNLTDFDAMRAMAKPIRNPSRGVVNDLLWADPENSINGWKKSNRGSGVIFGMQALQEFTDRMGIDLVVRAHQVCLDGYYIAPNFRLVTLFSAPMYCGLLRNAGGVLHVDENLAVNFSVFVPESKGVFKRIVENNIVWDNDVDQIADPPLRI